MRVAAAAAAALLALHRGAAGLTAEPSAAGLVSSAFGPSMVLQRAPAAAVLYGNATAHAAVSVWLDGAALPAAVAGADGGWRTALPPKPAGTGHKIVVRSGPAAVALDDIAFGEVWGCGGQSNMAFTVHMMGHGAAWLGHPAWDSADIIAGAAVLPDIRLMSVMRSGAREPVADPVLSQPWTRASPAAIGSVDKDGNFSAVCWLAGRGLRPPRREGPRRPDQQQLRRHDGAAVGAAGGGAAVRRCGARQ